MPSVNSRDELLELYALGERCFVESNLDDAEWNFEGCDLRSADFSRSYILASFRDSNLAGAKFCHANVKTCDFSGANLTGARFDGAAIDSATFDGARLDGTTFTDASAYGHTYRPGERP